MKPYETGICIHCGGKKEDHPQTEKGYRCKMITAASGGIPFLDSGTAHLCSEEVASKMLEALQKIARSHPDGNPMNLIQLAQEAINEALKR